MGDREAYEREDYIEKRKQTEKKNWMKAKGKKIGKGREKLEESGEGEGKRKCFI